MLYNTYHLPERIRFPQWKSSGAFSPWFWQLPRISIKFVSCGFSLVKSHLFRRLGWRLSCSDRFGWCDVLSRYVICDWKLVQKRGIGKALLYTSCTVSISWNHPPDWLSMSPDRRRYRPNIQWFLTGRRSFLLHDHLCLSYIYISIRPPMMAWMASAVSLAGDVCYLCL